MVDIVSENKLIQVCEACGTAACWYGEFLCQESKHADVVIKPVRELRKNPKESERYWSAEKMTMIYGEPSPFGFEPCQSP